MYVHMHASFLPVHRTASRTFHYRLMDHLVSVEGLLRPVTHHIWHCVLGADGSSTRLHETDLMSRCMYDHTLAYFHF